MNMNIRKCLGTSVLSVALLLASGIPGLAKDSRSITLTHDVIVNGATLPAGHYTVQWVTHSPEATVEFVQHHKVILSTQGKIEERFKGYDRNAVTNPDATLEARGNANDSDAVVYDTAPDGTMSLIEIHFAYTNKVLLLNQ